MARSISVNPDDVLTVDDVCQITRLGRTKVFELFASGEIQSFKSGEGRTCKRLTYRRDVTAYLDRQAAKGRAAVRPERGRRAEAAARTQRRAAQNKATDAAA